MFPVAAKYHVNIAYKTIRITTALVKFGNKIAKTIKNPKNTTAGIAPGSRHRSGLKRNRLTWPGPEPAPWGGRSGGSCSGWRYCHAPRPSLRLVCRLFRFARPGGTREFHLRVLEGVEEPGRGSQAAALAPRPLACLPVPSEPPLFASLCPRAQPNVTPHN